MQVWTIELRVSPPFERPHQEGVIVHLQVSDQPSLNSAQVWTRRFQGMDWMQDPPLTEVRIGKPQAVRWELAKFLLDKLRDVQIQIAPPGILSIHPTTYQLTIQSGLNSCQFKWSDELPLEWKILTEPVQILEALGNEGEVKA